MVTVKIEEVDESWALNLLDECQIEDETIVIETQKLEKTITQFDNYLMSPHLESDSLIQSLKETDHEDIEELDAVSDSLSAIECQKIMFVARQEAKELPVQIGKQKSNFILVRIKNLFSRK